MEISKEQVKRLIDKDMSAFDEIYAISRKTIFYTIYLIVKDSMASEDLMQEVYVDLLMNKKLKVDDNLAALLVTSAKNKALNYYKRHKFEQEYLSSLSDESYSNDDNLDSGLLQKVKAILNEKEYVVFVLHALGDYSFKEISELKGIPLGTLTWLYQEARKKLEGELGGHANV